MKTCDKSVTNYLLAPGKFFKPPHLNRGGGAGWNEAGGQPHYTSKPECRSIAWAADHAEPTSAHRRVNANNCLNE